MFAQSAEEYKEYGGNIMNLLVWMADEEIVDYSSFLVIVEDILETFPIKNLESLFDIFERNLTSKQYVKIINNEL